MNMKASEILTKIKTYLGEDVRLEQMKLENGTVLEAEAFEAGYEIFIITEDEKVALPVGDYELEDGKILIVEEEGLIAEIKEMEGEEEEAPAEEEATEETEMAEQVEETEMTEELSYISKEEFNSVIGELKGMIEKLVQEQTELKEVEEVKAQVREELSETPAADPLTHSPEQEQKSVLKFAQNRPQSTLDRVMSKLINQ